MSGDQLRQEYILDIVAKSLDQVTSGTKRLGELLDKVTQTRTLTVDAKLDKAYRDIEKLQNEAKGIKNISVGLDTTKFKKDISVIKSEMKELDKVVSSTVKGITKSLQQLANVKMPSLSSAVSSGLTSSTSNPLNNRAIGSFNGQLAQLEKQKLEAERRQADQFLKVLEERQKANAAFVERAKLLKKLDVDLVKRNVLVRETPYGKVFGFDPDIFQEFKSQIGQERQSILDKARKEIQKYSSKIDELTPNAELKSVQQKIKRAQSNINKIRDEAKSSLKALGDQEKDIKNIFRAFNIQETELSKEISSLEVGKGTLDTVNQKIEAIAKQKENQYAKIEKNLARLAKAAARSYIPKEPGEGYLLSGGAVGKRYHELGAAIANARESGDTQLLNALESSSFKIKKGEINLEEFIKSNSNKRTTVTSKFSGSLADALLGVSEDKERIIREEQEELTRRYEEKKKESVVTKAKGTTADAIQYGIYGDVAVTSKRNILYRDLKPQEREEEAKRIQEQLGSFQYSTEFSRRINTVPSSQAFLANLLRGRDAIGGPVSEQQNKKLLEALNPINTVIQSGRNRYDYFYELTQAKNISGDEFVNRLKRAVRKDSLDKLERRAAAAGLDPNTATSRRIDEALTKTQASQLFKLRETFGASSSIDIARDRELKGQFSYIYPKEDQEFRELAKKLNVEERQVSDRFELQNRIDAYRQAIAPFSDLSSVGKAQKRIDKSKGYVTPREKEIIAEEFGVSSKALKNNKFFDLKRLQTQPETQKQIAFALLFGGLPGALGSAIGGAIGGPSGALSGSVVSQFLVNFVEKPVEAAKEKFKELADAGLVFSRSILGIAAIGQETSIVTDKLGRQAGLETSLNFQQERAAQIQLTSRQKLLPIGIGGQTEATLVQGVVAALAQRGLQGTPDQIAKIAQLVGGTIQAQRPQLLDNPSLLLRDIQDVLGGGSNAQRTVLFQLGRSAFGRARTATSTEGIEKALEPLEGFTEAVTKSNNPVVALNKLNTAFDNLKTKAGTEGLNTVVDSIGKLADILKDPATVQAATKVAVSLGSVASGFNELLAKTIEISRHIPNLIFPLAQFDSGLEEEAKKAVERNKKLQEEPTSRTKITGLLTRVGLNQEEVTKFNTDRQLNNSIAAIDQINKSLEVLYGKKGQPGHPENATEFEPFLLDQKQKAQLSVLQRESGTLFDENTPIGKEELARFNITKVNSSINKILEQKRQAEENIILRENPTAVTADVLDLAGLNINGTSKIPQTKEQIDKLSQITKLEKEIKNLQENQKAVGKELNETAKSTTTPFQSIKKILDRNNKQIEKLKIQEKELSQEAPAINPEAIRSQGGNLAEAYKKRKEVEDKRIAQLKANQINQKRLTEENQALFPIAFEKDLKRQTDTLNKIGSSLSLLDLTTPHGNIVKDVKQGILTKTQNDLFVQLTQKRAELSGLKENDKTKEEVFGKSDDQIAAENALKDIALDFSKNAKQLLKDFKNLLSAINEQVQQSIEQLDTKTFGGQQEASFELLGGNIKKLSETLDNIKTTQELLQVRPNDPNLLRNLQQYQAQRGQLEAQSAGLFNNLFNSFKQQSNAQEQYTKQTKALNSTIDGELDQRKKLNLTLQDSIFALKEFKDEARLRELNAGLSAGSQAKSFQEKYGYLPANAAPESLYNQDVLKSLEQQRDQEAIDAAARTEANRPIKEGLEQDRLTQAVENNQKAFTSLTETKEQARKQLEQLRQDFSEKNNPLYDFRSGGDQSLGLPSGVDISPKKLSDRFASFLPETKAIKTTSPVTIQPPADEEAPIPGNYKPYEAMPQIPRDEKAQKAVDFIKSSIKQVNDALPSGINRLLSQLGVTEAIGPEIKDIDPILAAQQAEGRGGLTNNENGALYNPSKKQLLVSAKNKEFLKSQYLHEKGHGIFENLPEEIKKLLESDFIKDTKNREYKNKVKFSHLDPYFTQEANKNAEPETLAQLFANRYAQGLGIAGKPGLEQVYPTLAKDENLFLSSYEQGALPAPDFSKKYPFAFVPRHDKSKKGSTKETVSVGDTQGEDLIPVDGSQPVAVSAALKVTDQSTKDQKGKYNFLEKADGHLVYPVQKKIQEEVKKVTDKVKGVLPSPSFSQVRPRSPEEVEATGTGLTFKQEGYKDFTENMEKLDKLNSLTYKLDLESIDPNNTNKNYGPSLFKSKEGSVEDVLRKRVDKNLKGKRLFPSPNFSQDPYQKGIEEGKKIDPFALGASVDVQLAKANKVQNLQEEPDVFADLAKQDQDRKKNIFGGDLSEGHTKESGEEFLKSLSISKPQGNNDIAAAGTEREAIAKLEESLGAKLEDIVKVLVENAKNTPDAQTLRSIMTEAVQAGNERSFS